MFPLRLTSFLPEVPSSRLAPEDREPCDSRRPLLPEKSENIKFVSSVWNIGNYSEDEQHEKFCLNWIPQLLPKAKQLKKKKSTRTLKNHCLTISVTEIAILLFRKNLFLFKFSTQGKLSKLLTVVEVGQLSFLRAFAEAPVARPGEKHAFLPVSRIITTVLI